MEVLDLGHRAVFVLFELEGQSGDAIAAALGVLFVGEMCVAEACGRVRCWGRNRSGQTGDGTTIERQSPVDVIGLP
jgi:flagellar basal body P-ring protein FlgI